MDTIQLSVPENMAALASVVFYKSICLTSYNKEPLGV